MNSQWVNQVKSVIASDSVRIVWSDESESIFQFIWLRDNCACEKCGSHTSGSRFQSFLDIPEDIVPDKIVDEGSQLKIIWKNDGHESIFDYKWLFANCFFHQRPPIKRLWDGNLEVLPEVDYRVALENDIELSKLFSNVSEYGFVIVKNLGTDHEETLKLANRLGYVRNTHFGPVGNLMLRINGTHIADFPTEIQPHTDETYRPVPTGINIFHCIEPSDDGGGISTLVDSFGCAEKFAYRYPDLFDLLKKVPIKHERHVNGEIIRSNNPVFTTDCYDNLIEVRLNERSMSGIVVNPGQMALVYDALRKLFRIAYDPNNQIRYRLNSGEALVFDNLRVLHGRTGFRSNRLLRQTNVMRDEFYARMQYLNEGGSIKA